MRGLRYGPTLSLLQYSSSPFSKHSTTLRTERDAAPWLWYDAPPPPIFLLSQFSLDLFFIFCRRQNPNYVSAKLNGIVMTMFHEDLNGQEAPFGVVTFAGADSARLPARGSAVVQAQVCVVAVDHYC